MTEARKKSTTKQAGGTQESDLSVSVCNNFSLRKAMRHVSAMYDEVLSPAGLKATQRALLFTIARLHSPGVIQLAESMGLDRTTLTRNLRPLLRQALIVIDNDQADRRASQIRLTKKGEEKLNQTLRLWNEAQEVFERAYGKEDSRALRRALAVVASLEFKQTK